MSDSRSVACLNPTSLYDIPQYRFRSQRSKPIQTQAMVDSSEGIQNLKVVRENLLEKW